MTTLDASFSYCRDVARSRAKNFYYSFLLLPRAKRDAMCAIYAFMRECDDLSDEAGASLEALEAWREQLARGLAGEPGNHPVWPAFFDTVRRYRIPEAYFHEMIDGVESDLTSRRFTNFDDLYRYCYLVASVVGLTIIHIFGFEDRQALVLAEKCGVAFQLTNIIRDVKEDAEKGRVYIPGLEIEDALSPRVQPHLRSLGERAAELYAASRPLLGMVSADSRRSLWALMEIYGRLLRRIQASGYEVLAQRIRLSALEKISIVAQAWFR